MRATAEPVIARPASTGATTNQREMTIKRPPKTDEAPHHSHRQQTGWWWSPIVVVVAPAFGVALWHGGYTRGGLLAFAAVAAAGLALVRPAPPAAATVLFGRPDGGRTGQPGIAGLEPRQLNGGGAGGGGASAAGLVGSAGRPALARWLPLIVLALGLATATAGLAGLALRSPPLAERIAGVWRAGGTFEYPPALGLFCVCALAFALALHAAGGSTDLTAGGRRPADRGGRGHVRPRHLAGDGGGAGRCSRCGCRRAPHGRPAPGWPPAPRCWRW